MSVTVRKAAVSDIEVLVELRVALFAEVGTLGSSPEEVASFREANRGYFARTLEAGTFSAWVAEVDGSIIASSGLVFFDAPPRPADLGGREAYVMNMYVRPEHRRRGVGLAILRAIIAEAKGKGAGHLLLLATPAGRRLYEKADFKPSDRAMERAL